MPTQQLQNRTEGCCTVVHVARVHGRAHCTATPAASFGLPLPASGKMEPRPQMAVAIPDPAAL